MIEVGIRGLTRNLARDYKESTRITPAKALSKSGEGASTGLTL